MQQVLCCNEPIYFKKQIKLINLVHDNFFIAIGKAHFLNQNVLYFSHFSMEHVFIEKQQQKQLKIWTTPLIYGKIGQLAPKHRTMKP